jgi:peptidoglycan/xylan/chitin deacetylase (PgdA/CDA1 family)
MGTASARAAGTATFALTFDTELIWGSFDHLTVAEFERRYPDARGVIRAILAMLASYDVPATWAVVGHLYLDACTRSADGVAHPELIHPRQSWHEGDWYARDPCTDRGRDPMWYGDDIVEALLKAGGGQEIGCHSFAHALYGDPRMTAEAARADLDRCRELAAARGVTLRSFVFPRNVEGHHGVLRDAGFTAFRGADPAWHAGLGGTVGRSARYLDHFAAMRPPVSVPTEQLPGLWNVPGSMLLLHRSGARRFVTLEARMRKARRGLAAARERNAVFHLWTHPFNLASDPDGLLRVLERVVHDAAEMRERGELVIETMSAIAGRMAARSAVADPSEQT